MLTRVFQHLFGEKGSHESFCSYVLLSTCNRVEIYFGGENIASIHVQLIALLRRKIMLPFEHVLYSYFSSDVFLHLARVTSGLDSAILGETEIQRQVKVAYALAKGKRPLTAYMHYLFQKSLRLGKQTRSLYNLSKGKWQLEELVVSQLKLFAKRLPLTRVLLIGNSEMNRRLLPLLSSMMFKEMMLCSRRGIEASLIDKYPLLQMGNMEVLKLWENYDVIISATTHEKHVLQKQKRKTHHKMIMVDLSIPRSLDPLFVKDPTVNLLNLEDLAAIFEENKRVYKTELSSCEEVLHRCVERYYELYQVKIQKNKEYSLL